jgi:hypothetical protein
MHDLIAVAGLLIEWQNRRRRGAAQAHQDCDLSRSLSGRNVERYPSNVDFYYSGTPHTAGRFGGFTFGKDPAGRP